MGRSMKNKYKLMANPNSYGRTTCSAFGCDMRCGTNALSKIKMFHFPKDPLRRRWWELATRRANWKAGSKSRLCCKHFITGKPSKDPKHPDHVPSVFVFSKNVQNFESSLNKSSKLEIHEKLNSPESELCENLNFHGSTLSRERTGITPSYEICNFCGNSFSTESVSSPLNETLTQLMVRLKYMEEERDQLCGELANCREEIHQLRTTHQQSLLQTQSTSMHSNVYSSTSIPSTTSNNAIEILESMYSDKPPDVYDPDSLHSQFVEKNYLLPDKSSKSHWKKRVEDSNLESKRTKESVNGEKFSSSSSPITIVYLKR